MNSLCCLQKWHKSEDAAVAARRMLKAVAETHSVDHHDLHITC